MFGIFAAIKTLLGFGTSIASAIADAKIAALNAGTEEERIRAEERVKTLELIAATVQQDRYASLVRTCFTVPYVVFIAKVVLWDKVLQWGATDALSVELWSVLYVILGYYFIRWLRNGT